MRSALLTLSIAAVGCTIYDPSLLSRGRGSTEPADDVRPLSPTPAADVAVEGPRPMAPQLETSAQAFEAAGSAFEPSVEASAPDPVDSATDARLGADASPARDLIDDLEHTGFRMPAKNGRLGVWMIMNDGSGTQTPPAANAANGYANEFTTTAVEVGRAACTSGHGFLATEGHWPAQMGFDLVALPSRTTYDAGARGITGITFLFRSGAANRTSVSLRIVDRDTDPMGGRCDPHGDAATECFGFYFYSLEPSPDWTRITLRWTDFFPPGFGYHGGGIATDALYGMNFAIDGWDQAFDYCVDDLAFTLD